MVSKLVAARIATAAGCTVVLAGADRAPAGGPRGRRRAAPCSPPAPPPRRARKEWIAASLGVTGSLTIDAGALAALRRGSSLLPAGVTAVEGAFERGDPILVRAADGSLVAKGLVGLRCRATPAASPAAGPRRSRPSWASAAATR